MTDPGEAEGALPHGEVYDWYVRGRGLLEGGNAAAAAQLLSHAAAAEPESRAVREALARAQFDSGMHAEAAASFRVIVEADPSDDYAHFGLGLSAARLGDFETAVEHLAMASAMRPDRSQYTDALRNARATLRARAGE